MKKNSFLIFRPHKLKIILFFRDIIASCDHNGEVRVWTKQAGVEWESTILRQFSFPLWDVSWRLFFNFVKFYPENNKK